MIFMTIEFLEGSANKPLPLPAGVRKRRPDALIGEIVCICNMVSNGEAICRLDSPGAARH